MLYEGPNDRLRNVPVRAQDWESAKRVLGRSSFMDELCNYNKEDMTSERRKSLKRYVEDENMSVDRLRKVSRELVIICEHQSLDTAYLFSILLISA